MTDQTYAGRLELTWTNKPLRLLAHEDGSYEWVNPADYRVAEVRLLHDITTVGEVGNKRAADNLLIRGDALNALTSLARLPEFASEYLGKVKLAYLDPPFNTQQSFLQYDDALEHSVWLTMMRDRLLQIRDLLAPEGSVWVHLDDAEVHRCRSALDEVFGPENFITTVVWNKSDSPRNSARYFSVDQDYIHVYAKDASVWRPNRLPRTAEIDSSYKNPDNDPRGPWIPGDPFANKPYSLGTYEVTGPTGNVFGPPPGRYWRIAKEKFLELDRTGRIWWRGGGEARPRIKRYLSEVADLVPRTSWDHSEVGSNATSAGEIRRLFPGVPVFATPKPEKLMQRIVTVASKPGDIVLDCFLGSGTMAAVAHKMGRRWIGIERELATIETFALPRLQKVVAGEDPGGITNIETPVEDDLPDGVKPGESRAAAKVLENLAKAGVFDDLDKLDEETTKALVRLLRTVDKTKTETIWFGGGGFRVLEVSPSMFEAEGGLVFLADWMANGKLAEATAAQLGYEYEPDPPFSGRKGRTRLAVVDGVVNESVVRLLVAALPERERVVICGTGIDTDARPILRELRPGSTLRKIPAALLDEYRSLRQLPLALKENTDELKKVGS